MGDFEEFAGQLEPLLLITLGVEVLRLLMLASFIHSLIHASMHALFLTCSKCFSIVRHCTVFIIKWNPRVSPVHLA